MVGQCYAVTLTVALHLQGCLQFALGIEKLPPVAVTALRNGSLYLGDLMVTPIEVVYLSLILPPPLATLLMCIHLTIFFAAVNSGGLLPSLPVILGWSLLMEVRHVLLA